MFTIVLLKQEFMEVNVRAFCSACATVKCQVYWGNAFQQAQLTQIYS